MMQQTTFEKLRRFNMIMGAFHLVQGLLMVVFAVSVLGDINPAFKSQLHKTS